MQSVPLQQRAGTPASEQQLLNILRGNELTQPTRSERESRPSPALLAHNLPLSAGPSRSAVPTAKVTRSSPEAARSTLDRVMQSIDLVTQARQNRHHSAAASSNAAPEANVPPSTPMDEDISGSHQTEPDVPIIYEGMDEACSICQETFQHGQLVCRLSCRHMYHAACWDRAQQDYNTTPSMPRLNCPNCRGAGTVIAAWHYIDSERVT